MISHDGRVVRFWARSREKPPRGQRPEMVREELPAVEFTRRWALHILPKSFIKVRRYGGYSNVHRRDYFARCRQLLGLDDEPTQDQPQADDNPPPQITEHRFADPVCPRCQQPMICVRATDRPSWSITMHSEYRPPWYHDD